MVGFKSVNVGKLSEESAKEWADTIRWARRAQQEKQEKDRAASQDEEEKDR